MSKSWPFGLVVIVVGGLARRGHRRASGVERSFVLERSITGAVSTSSTSAR